MGTALLSRTPCRRQRLGLLAVVSLGLFAPGCGRDAFPVDLDLDLYTSASTSPTLLSVRGYVDPDATDFDEGQRLVCRWAVEDDRARAAELNIDIDLGEANDTRVTVLTSDAGTASAALRRRFGDGSVLERGVVRRLEVRLTPVKDRGRRDRDTGAFELELEPGGSYVAIVGTWRPPSESTPAPVGHGDYDRERGDSQSPPGDESDTTPPSFGDFGSGDDASGTGCNCQGEVTEDLPVEPAPGDTDVTPPSSGDDDSSGTGCNCQGDTGSDDGDSDTSGGDSASSEGTSDDSSGSGCNCQGEDTSSTTAGTSSSQLRPTAAGTHAAKPRQVRTHVCRANVGKQAFELTPFGFAFWLSRRRRRYDDR